jgi:hypothetical protein
MILKPILLNVPVTTDNVEVLPESTGLEHIVQNDKWIMILYTVVQYTIEYSFIITVHGYFSSNLVQCKIITEW